MQKSTCAAKTLLIEGLAKNIVPGWQKYRVRFLVAPNQLVIFHCQSGMRTATNAGRLAGTCKGEAYVLAGGLNAWKEAGLPLKKGVRK